MIHWFGCLPLSIPIRYGLVCGEEGDARDALTVLSARETTIVEENLKTRPTLSILRAFSAPVRVVRDLDGAERTALMSGDTDPFNRWEASRSFAMDLLKADASAGGASAADGDILAFADALAASLADETLEPAYRAELLALPNEMEVALSLEQIDPEAVSAARSRLRRAVAGRLDGLLRDIYHRFASNAPYSPDADAAGRRALRNTALDMLLALNDDATAALATEQAASAANMTDEAAAVSALARSGRPEREGALAAFYEKWRAEPLIVNKWLGWRAASPSADALQTVKELMAHEAFDIRTPNKVRAVLGVFSNQNLRGFHRADGAAYEFFVDQLLTLDAINPQLAARLATGLEAWRRFEPKRAGLMETQLKRLSASADLSDNLAEVASRLVG